MYIYIYKLKTSLLLEFACSIFVWLRLLVFLVSLVCFIFRFIDFFLSLSLSLSLDFVALLYQLKPNYVRRHVVENLYTDNAYPVITGSTHTHTQTHSLIHAQGCLRSQTAYNFVFDFDIDFNFNFNSDSDSAQVSVRPVDRQSTQCNAAGCHRRRQRKCYR